MNQIIDYYECGIQIGKRYKKLSLPYIFKRVILKFSKIKLYIFLLLSKIMESQKS